jgi:uncharacterized protein (UPF0332 family)
MPGTWIELASDGRKAANVLATEDRYRSCVARAYYAAYSKVTHALIAAAQLPPPPGREGFGHLRTRQVIVTSMPDMDQTKRHKLSELLGRLYTLRIDADYKPSTLVEAREAREALSIMKTIFESF